MTAPLTHPLKSFSVTLSSTDALTFELSEKVHDRVCWYELKTRVLSGKDSVDLTDHDYRHEFEFDTEREAVATMKSIVSQIIADEYPEEFEN